MEFSTLKSLQKYTEKHGRFEENEVVKITDTGEFYAYHNSEWVKIDISSSGATMNLYDINKQIFAQFDNYTEEQWQESIEKLNQWSKDRESLYYMMLCKEISHYTVLHKDNEYPECESFGQAIRECLEYTGKVVFMEFNDTNECVEIWVKDEENKDAHVLLLFEYDTGVVSYKE